MFAPIAFMSQARAENATVLASTHEGTEGLVSKVALLEGELLMVCRARDVAEEKIHSLSDAAADGADPWL
jgi:hypothetical protein